MMYIPAFWVGVMATLASEFLALMIYVSYLNYKKRKNQNGR